VGTVASIVDGNEILRNGESLGMFQAGDLWQGQVNSGDSFTASGPIYGISRSGNNAYVMAPGRLRGREFAVPNSRRSAAQLNIVCLENPCHVTVSSSSGVTNTEDIPPDSYMEITVGGAVGGDEAITVSSSEPIVLAVCDATGNTDYMPVPPVAAELFGIASTILSVATVGENGMEVTESCSDESTQTLALPRMGGQVESPGYERQYTGKACRLTSTTLELGRPRTFGAHGYGDGDGGDATPFLPRSLFSTEFVTAAPYEFLAFVSDEPGTIDVNGVQVELEGVGDVYRARVNAGEAGERISSTVPVWAVLEDRQSNEEQLLYGNIGSSPIVDIDRFAYRLFVARAQSMPGFVASIVDGNELSLNGAVVGTLNAGEVWTGDVSFGDVFSAQGPIYGVVDDRTADQYQSADAYLLRSIFFLAYRFDC
jgi:hypothetical protein